MIAKNLNNINTQIAAAAQKSGRDRAEIKLVAVSKRFPVETIIEACKAGQFLFGENYIQEVTQKKPEAPENACIHFIGNLQSNKAKIAAELCDMVQTVDREKLGKALNKHCITLNKTLDVLVQVNIGNDPNKSGVDKEKAAELIRKLNALSNLKVCGLMTIPPLSNTPEESRVYFRDLRLLLEDLTEQGLFSSCIKPELSMGMSGDFHVAIEEGATIIRVGTAIFGQRLT
ncbi:MAG: YggS family pyridoxal phosphate-dependent enzyme [Desulfotalea sp.]|nr:MAG: YggS family pyridoxal phosphate-dependent enzyme [Desulfotalea sp.]